MTVSGLSKNAASTIPNSSVDAGAKGSLDMSTKGEDSSL
jgi:hypothetical protein